LPRPGKYRRLARSRTVLAKEIFKMTNKTKGAALAAAAGSMMMFGGCLDLNWQRLIWDTAIYAAQEFVLDNDGVFDLFEGGATG